VRRDETADNVRVTAEILGAAVHDASAPSASGCWRYGVARCCRRRPRTGVCELRDGGDVDDVERGIGRRSTQTIRVAPVHVGDCIEVAEVDGGPVDAETFVDAPRAGTSAIRPLGRITWSPGDSVRKTALGGQAASRTQPVTRLRGSEARLERRAVGLPLRPYS
jgi:hypothetical protein